MLLGIILLALFLRFQNINWDSNFHLHPDERFLTMVGNAMKIPSSIEQYFNPDTSPLNPPNGGFSFFVYGAFPIILNKIIAVIFGNDTYNAFALQGRILSGLADMLVLLLVYKTAELLFVETGHAPSLHKNKNARNLPLWSAFFYAIAVLPIQLSHFFTTDSFLNLFMFASFYFALRFYVENNFVRTGLKPVPTLFFSALFFGLAIASKISAIYILPLILFFLCFPLIKERKFGQFLKCLLFFLVTSYLVIRIANPYYFRSTDLFDPRLNATFEKSITELKAMSDGKVWFPPAVQWHSKMPVLFSLFNLSVFGLGIPYFIFTIIGMFSAVSLELIAISLWVAGYFLYNSLSFTKALRYLIFLFPFFSLFAAIGVSKAISYKQSAKSYKLKAISIIIILLIWPLMFSTIYLQKHTRVQASEWIYQNLPSQSLILSEYWDDGLPLRIEDALFEKSQSKQGKMFKTEELHVFDPDNEEKWKKMSEQLQRADYYILSSNRGWGSVPTVPKKYPQMSKYYADLFDGKTNYKLIKKFIPTYQFLFPFHPNSWFNNWFEETFTVYDHPSVFIFKNIK